MNWGEESGLHNISVDDDCRWDQAQQAQDEGYGPQPPSPGQDQLGEPDAGPACIQERQQRDADDPDKQNGPPDGGGQSRSWVSCGSGCKYSEYSDRA